MDHHVMIIPLFESPTNTHTLPQLAEFSEDPPQKMTLTILDQITHFFCMFTQFLGVGVVNLPTRATYQFGRTS